MNIFWFIGALVCIYILFPALKALFDTNKKAVFFFVITCSIFTFGVVIGNNLLAFAKNIFHYNIDSIDTSFLTMFNPLRGIYGYTFAYFCIGGLLYAYEDRILSIKKQKRNLLFTR